MADKKTDNSNLAVKLTLRRHFLRKYHGDDPPNVLDCCQGDGVLWGKLREEFALAGYWGVDLKPKRGRLKIDSARILAQPGWTQNVIDLDTYGSPWKHWAALTPHVTRPTTVFLTVGLVQMGGGGMMSNQGRAAIGLGKLHVPTSILGKLHEFSLSYLLTSGCVSPTIIVEVVEATSLGNARYLGVRLERKRAGRKR
jgi:hypothetical protein